MEFPPTQVLGDVSRDEEGDCSDDARIAKKRLRKQRNNATRQSNRERAYNPGIEQPTSIDVGKHFLGRALVCVVFRKLGGNGPVMESTPLDRDLVQSQVQKLVSLAGENASTLFRDDPEHELVMTVDREAIDERSLTKSITGPFPFVRFNRRADQHTATLEHGKHRRQAILDLFGPSLKELTRLDEAAATEEGRKAQKFRRLRDQLMETLNKDAYWLVAFYDKNSILEDSMNTQAIFLKLATNSAHKGTPETPVHHFRQIVHSLLQSTNPTERAAVHSFASTLEPDKKSDVRLLLTKYPDVVNTFTFLFNFRSFYTYGFDPKKLVRAKKTVWGLVLPFIIGGTRSIQWLASKKAVPLVDGEVLDESTAPTLSRKITNRIVLDIAEDDTCDLDVGEFVISLARFNYRCHLAPAMDYFGVGSEVWANRMKKYHREFLKNAKARITAELRIGGRWGRPQREILKVLYGKLSALFRFSLLQGAYAVPALSGGVPLFAPEVLSSLIDQCLTIEPVVSLMCSWIVPNLKDYHSQRLSPKASAFPTDSKRFRSDFELLVSSLQYFLGFQMEDVDWSHTPVDDLLQNKLPGQRHNGYRHIQEVVHEILCLVFKERHHVFIPHIGSVQQLLGRMGDTSKSEEYTDRVKKDLDLFLLALGEWAEAKETIPSDTSKLDILRHTQPLPVEAMTDFLKTANPVWSKVVQGFVASTFPWSVGGKNGAAIRRRFTLNMLQEAQHYVDACRLFLAENPALGRFRKRLVESILRTPSLEHFPLWISFTAIPPPLSHSDPPDEFEDELVKDNQSLRKSNESSQAFDKAFQSFLRALAKPGVLGIPVNPKQSRHALHPHAVHHLKELRKLVSPLQADCSAIHARDKTFSPRFGEPPEGSIDEESWGLDWNVATEEQVKAFYQTMLKPDTPRATHRDDDQEHGSEPRFITTYLSSDWEDEEVQETDVEPELAEQEEMQKEVNTEDEEEDEDIQTELDAEEEEEDEEIQTELDAEEEDEEDEIQMEKMDDRSLDSEDDSSSEKMDDKSPDSEDDSSEKENVRPMSANRSSSIYQPSSDGSRTSDDEDISTQPTSEADDDDHPSSEDEVEQAPRPKRFTPSPLQRSLASDKSPLSHNPPIGLSQSSVIQPSTGIDAIPDHTPDLSPHTEIMLKRYGERIDQLSSPIFGRKRTTPDHVSDSDDPKRQRLEEEEDMWDALEDIPFPDA